MAGYAENKAKLAALGVQVIAASVDPEDKAVEVAAELSFPVAFGVTRADAEAIGAWWSDERAILQPAEFVLGPDGKVLQSSYSSGPIGRMDAPNTLALIESYEARKK